MDLEAVESSLTLLNDFEGIICNSINHLLATATEKAQLEPDASEDCFDVCMESMKGYAASHNRILLFRDAFKEFKTAMKDVDGLPKDIDEKLLTLYEEKCQHCLPPESHSGYKTLISALSEVLSSGDGIAKETLEDEENDIVVTRKLTVPIDPITKLEVTDPVRSKLCQHKYDRTSITEYIQRRNDRAKCPMIGCGKPLTEEMLEIDDEVLLLINRKQRLLNTID